jgi:protein ImuB
MQRVMCIWIADWPIARLARERADLRGRTVVLYEASPQGGLKVVAATSALGVGDSTEPAGVTAGIYPGMPLAEAAAIVAHAQQVVHQHVHPPTLESPRLDSTELVAGRRGVERDIPTTIPRQSRGLPKSDSSSPHAPHLEAADPQADRWALMQLAEWCQRFSPIVGIEDAPRPECLLLDVTGLAHLFDGERSLAEEVTGALTGRGLDARVAIADTIGAAWAVVHNDSFIQILPPGNILAALAPLPIGYLRVAEETVALLATLGIYRVGQLAALPRSALLARFGSELLWRLDQATGQAPETILARHLPAEYAADFTFEAPLANREAIEHVLGQLIARAIEPLARRREGVLRLACRLKYEQAWDAEPNRRTRFSLAQAFTPGIAVSDGDHAPLGAKAPTKTRNGPLNPGVNAWATEKKTGPDANRALAEPVAHDFAFCVGLFWPSASADYLRDLLRLRLESVRLAGPVTSMHVEVTAVGPLELRQQALFDGQQNQEQPRRLAELVDRLSNRLGRGAVVQVALLPDAQPEYTCVDVPLAGGAAAAAAVSKSARKKRTKKNLAHVGRYGLLSFAADERPLALLPQPARIDVLGIAPDGTPARFCWAGRHYSIAHAWGPERIETGWWRRAEQSGTSKPRGHAFVRRDYYRVETTSGARFWIFRRLGDRQWFLHGRFD